MHLTVLLPTHHPHPGRLRRVLEALNGQTLAKDQWELVLIDNASDPPVGEDVFSICASVQARIVRETELGLTHARRRGIGEARGEILVLVDDDNVLASDYLQTAVEMMQAHPDWGTAGGEILPEFEVEPEPWMREFLGLLAVRSLGEAVQVAPPLDPNKDERLYPSFAPVGAGMVLRRDAARQWMKADDEGRKPRLVDRKGGDLSSGGDNDIVFYLLLNGWSTAYAPGLRLIHILPATRLSKEYLAKLNYGIQKSWVGFLLAYQASPWGSLSGLVCRLGKLKAFIKNKPWISSSHFVRWQGVCGHYEGRKINT